MVQKLENELSDEQPKNPPSPKSRLAVLKRNKKANSASDPFRFQGTGVTYKGKLIGERDVDSARGDTMCAEAMRAAKAAVKAAGAHKTRISLQINIDGIKIVDEKSNAVLHNFPVSRVSFIARDTTDARAFGIVFGPPDNKYKFYGIKTAQNADQAVLAIRDMFQVVFEMKKKHIEQVKQQHEEQKDSTTEGGVVVADLLDLETEVQQIQQGLQQLEQIPTGIDAFGASPFVDQFADSFVSNASSINSSTLSQQHNTFSQPTFTAPVQQSWPQVPVQMPVNNDPFSASWGTPLISQQQTHPIHHTHSTPIFQKSTGFSETNPFAPVVAAQRAAVQDPFDTQTHQTPTPHIIDWGTNENAAPYVHHSNSFTSNHCFTDNNIQHKWEETKKVTSLEEAFSKLVDMNALVGRPAETKKNPFEHILNPPKVSLNSLGAMPVRSSTVIPPGPTTDPFGDDFFR